MLKASGVIKIRLAQLVTLDVQIQMPIFLKRIAHRNETTDTAIDNNETY